MSPTVYCLARASSAAKRVSIFVMSSVTLSSVSSAALRALFGLSSSSLFRGDSDCDAGTDLACGTFAFSNSAFSAAICAFRS